jgi:hypothetical protein
MALVFNDDDIIKIAATIAPLFHLAEYRSLREWVLALLRKNYEA